MRFRLHHLEGQLVAVFFDGHAVGKTLRQSAQRAFDGNLFGGERYLDFVGHGHRAVRNT